MKKILILLILMIVLLSCVKKEEEKQIITISAAASLKSSLDEIVHNYKNENKNIEININYGGSGTLEKQIISGAEVNIFISAAKKNMDNLEKNNLIDIKSRKDLLKNTLVLIASNSQKDKIKTIEDIKKVEKIALGEEKTVPAGKYGKEVLEKLGLFKEIEKKVVYQKDVTSVLNIVELGEVEVGIVYLTDAKKLKNGYVVTEFDSNLHTPIVYPVAIIENTKNKEKSEEFLKYLENEKAKEIFKNNGFKY